MKKIGFLVSGNGGTLKFIHMAIKKLELPIEIVFVIGDRHCKAIEYAEKEGLENCIIRYNLSNSIELNTLLDRFNEVDLIITNIHKIIGEEVLKKMDGKFINLHYSLLPSYGGMIGMKTVDAAKIDNAMFLGTTCHEVNEKLDGGTIICQSCMKADWEISELLIYDQIFKSACLVILNSIIIKLNLKTNYINTDKHGLNQYNPELSFDKNIFDDSFWHLLKNI